MELYMNNYYENGRLVTSQSNVNSNLPPKVVIIKKVVCRANEGKLKLWTGGGKNLQSVNTRTEKLSELRSSSTVRRVDVRLTRPLACGKFILRAIDRIIKNGIFIDWLLLKCEVTNIPFTRVHEEIEIFSTTDFQSLKHIIDQESCLPLPFIYRENNNSVKYFMLNFNTSVNRKCEKLNSRVFFDVNNKEILVSFDVGIVLEGGYDKRVDNFKIHVSKSLEPYVQQHLTEIKRLIVYNHVLWGYLQEWVKSTSSSPNILINKETGANVTVKFSNREVAANLTLHRIEISEIKQLNELNTIFLIASFADFALYLKFTPLRRGDYFTFMIDNIETPVTSTISLIQYYRQFFYINDESKSNALKCLLDYSQSKKNFLDLENVCEYETSDKKLNNEKPLLKTKSVDEINASVKEVNKDLQDEDSIVKLLKSGAIDKEKVKKKLLPFVKESLQQCFEKNPNEILDKDETSDTSLMVIRFQDAVCGADRSGSFQAFLEHVYNSLQMHFTNVTCQKIMECMIYKELENKYNNQNGVLQESVGEKELEQLVTEKEMNKGVKRKGETPEDNPSLKMPKLMPLREFIKLERKKDEGLKYSCKLKSCSVVLNRMDKKTLDEKKISMSNGTTSPRIDKETRLNGSRRSPRASKENSSDESKNDTNFMLKFPRIFMGSRSRNSSKCESDTTHESDEEPVRKSKHFWDQEKVYRACITSKAVVVLNRLEDVVGLPCVQKKTVIITKDNKLEIKPEPLSPQDHSKSTEELGIKKEPPIEKRSISVQVEVNEVDTSEKHGGAETPKKDVGVDTSEAKSTEDDLEIIQVIEPAKLLKPEPTKKKCGRCTEEFNSYKEVEEHEKSFHKNEKIYHCNHEKCGKRFYALNYLELHKITKHEKRLHCNYCDITFKNADDLENHLMSPGHEEKRNSHVEVL